MMIRKIKLYITLAAVALSATSCLDKYPEDAILEKDAMTTVEQANQVVVGIYSGFKNAPLYSGYLTLLPDLQADFAYAVTGYSNVYGNVWRWDILATNNEITDVYGALYAIIGRCNFFLENVDKVAANTVDDDKLDKLDECKGEVYFARALAYSELIKMFCKAYDPKTAVNELGVALVSQYSNAPRPKRASLKESYQFVLDDLQKAATYLEPDEDDTTVLYNSVYFTIGAVNSLYARVYLYMQDWEKAIEYSTKVIESGDYTLASTTKNSYSTTVNDYDYMWQYDASTEIIWKVGFELTSYGGKLGQVFFNTNWVTFKPDYVPATWVLNLYESGDLRASAFFASATTGYSHALTWPLLLKYYGNRTFMSSSIAHVCMPKPFRLSEQYLIRAEAYCNLDKVGKNPDYTKAGKDLTKLRLARYKSYGGSTTLTSSNWEKTIENERVKELYMEGFRLTDLKRWHKGFERTPQTSTLSPGNSLKIDASNSLFVWPIPQHELQSPDADIEPNESNK